MSFINSNYFTNSNYATYNSNSSDKVPEYPVLGSFFLNGINGVGVEKKDGDIWDINMLDGSNSYSLTNRSTGEKLRAQHEEGNKWRLVNLQNGNQNLVSIVNNPYNGLKTIIDIPDFDNGFNSGKA